MHGLLHQRGSLLHLFQADVHRTGHINQHALGAVNGGLQQGAGNRHAGGFLRLALAGGPAHAHMGKTGVLHHRSHIGEVQIDKAGITNQIGNRLHCLAQHVISNLKSIGEGDLLIGSVLQTLVGNDDKGVHLAAQLFNTLLGSGHTAASLKTERLGDNTHGQYAQFTGNFCHNGRRAGTRTAAHTGRDKDHIRLFQRLGDLVAAFLGSLAAHFGIGACTLTAGQLFTDLDFIVCTGCVQCLLICVDRNKVNALCAGAHHAVDNIIAAAANTHYFDADYTFRASFQSKSHDGSSCHNLYHDDRLSVRKHHIEYILYCITEWFRGQGLCRDFTAFLPHFYLGIKLALPSWVKSMLPFSLSSKRSTTALRYSSL